MVVRGGPGPWTLSPEEAELRDLTERLRAATRILVSWGPRGAVGNGAGICSESVECRLPGEPEFRQLSNAELASLRALELSGEIEIHWPFICGQLDGHAPFDPVIEHAAAQLLQADSPKTVLSATDLIGSGVGTLRSAMSRWI